MSLWHSTQWRAPWCYRCRNRGYSPVDYEYHGTGLCAVPSLLPFVSPGRAWTKCVFSACRRNGVSTPHFQGTFSFPGPSLLLGSVRIGSIHMSA